MVGEKMKNIFIISNAYASSNIISSLDYVLDTKIESVFLLSEFHQKTDLFWNSNAFNINICEDPIKCVEKADLIIQIKDQFGRIKSDAILDIARKHDKKTVSIFNPWELESHSDIDKNSRDDKQNNTPTILIISAGPYAQLYCVETLLNREFSNHGITIKQKFSSEAKCFFKILKDNNININNQVINSINTKSNNNFNVFIEGKTYYIFDSISDCEKLYAWIKQHKPDYIILITNLDKVDFTSIAESFYIRYGKNIDCIIQPQFISASVLYDISRPIYIGKATGHYFSADLKDSIDDFCKGLYENIVTKITLPKDVNIL